MQTAESRYARPVDAKAKIQWFPSKIDGWLAIILVIAPLVSLIGYLHPDVWTSAGALAIASGGPAMFVAIYGLVVFPTTYGIGERELIVRFGVIRRRFELAKIELVEPTHSPLSSPALSLDRLRISSGRQIRDNVTISPRDREGFLQLLAERSGLVREGDRLVRK